MSAVLIHPFDNVLAIDFMIKKLITNKPYFTFLMIILMLTNLRTEVSAATLATCTLPQTLQNNACITPTAAVSAQTMVRILTTLGVIDIQLLNSAPLTVANFLGYLGSGAYRQSFFYRSIPRFIIQSGGYTWNSSTNTATSISKLPAVVNEYSATRSNLRGTIAMAKVGSDPNSATNQWFINLTNNSANLDAQNAGFTVFGQVVAYGMSVADAIAALPTTNAGGDFTNLPLATPVINKSISTSNLVMVSSITANSSNATASTSDRIFSYLEATYPSYISPGNPLTPNGTGSSILASYYYRYYANTNSYVATMDGNVYYLGSASNNQIMLLGTLASWLNLAIAAGY